MYFEKVSFVGSMSAIRKAPSLASAVSDSQRMSVVLPVFPRPTKKITFFFEDRSAPFVATFGPAVFGAAVLIAISGASSSSAVKLKVARAVSVAGAAPSSSRSGLTFDGLSVLENAIYLSLYEIGGYFLPSSLAMTSAASLVGACASGAFASAGFFSPLTIFVPLHPLRVAGRNSGSSSPIAGSIPGGVLNVGKTAAAGKWLVLVICGPPRAGGLAAGATGGRARGVLAR